MGSHIWPQPTTHGADRSRAGVEGWGWGGRGQYGAWGCHGHLLLHLGKHQSQGLKFCSQESWTGEAALDLRRKWILSLLLPESSLELQTPHRGRPAIWRRGPSHHPPNLRFINSPSCVQGRAGGTRLEVPALRYPVCVPHVPPQSEVAQAPQGTVKNSGRKCSATVHFP